MRLLLEVLRKGPDPSWCYLLLCSVKRRSQMSSYRRKKSGVHSDTSYAVRTREQYAIVSRVVHARMTCGDCLLTGTWMSETKNPMTHYIIGPGRWGCNIKLVIFKFKSMLDVLSICCKIVLRWMPKYLIDDKSTLVREWHGAVRQQAINWTIVDQVLCRIWRHYGPTS